MIQMILIARANATQFLVVKMNISRTPQSKNVLVHCPNESTTVYQPAIHYDAPFTIVVKDCFVMYELPA